MNALRGVLRRKGDAASSATPDVSAGEHAVMASAPSSADGSGAGSPQVSATADVASGDSAPAHGERHELPSAFALPYDLPLDMRLLAVIASSVVVAVGMLLAMSALPSGGPAATDDATSGAPITEEVAASGESPGSPASSDADASASDNSDYQYANDVLGVYETRASAGDESVRAKNLQTAARSLNGVVIAAGESLSLNEIVGEPTAERGYEDVAGVEQAIDAVDQVASTLHVAALKAGLTIVERNAHMTPVDYVPLGMDAMVAWEMEDLVIENNLEGEVTIQATASGTTVTISILGTPADPSLVYDIESLVVDTYTRSAADLYDDPAAQGLLASDDVQVSLSETYLVTYRDRTQVSRDLLYADTYQVYDTSSDRAAVGNGF